MEREDRGIRKSEGKTTSAVLICANDTRTFISESKRKYMPYYVFHRLTHVLVLYCLLSVLWQKTPYFFLCVLVRVHHSLFSPSVAVDL